MGILVVARRINLRFMFIYVAHPQTGAQYGESYAVYNAIEIFFGFVGRLVGVKEVSPQIKAGYGWVKRKNQRRVLLMDVKASEKV